MDRKQKIIIHVIIPMLIGGFIYILFRENNLLMFSWFYSLGLDNLINNLRDSISFNNQIPGWIIYNFPDGIWIYSLTSLMLIIWSQNLSKLQHIWLYMGPVLGIINIIPGTFDNTDLIFCFFASVIPFLVFNHNNKRIMQ